MELPQYSVILNPDAINEPLINGSFEGNARILMDQYVRFLPVLETHMATLDNKAPKELIYFNECIAEVLYGLKILSLFKEKVIINNIPTFKEIQNGSTNTFVFNKTSADLADTIIKALNTDNFLQKK